ncbi:hypothetical protein lerEdw1_021050 [Lerista edwardsae]|nr:hypothetical protein lerEdw1_021050 [Lerista edwardsae]
MLLKGAGVEATRRVLVYLSKDRHSRPQRAQFQQSIIDHFCAARADSVMVNCGLLQRQFLIADREFAGSSPALLQRPPFCPIKHLSVSQAASLPAETRGRGVDVGVAVLLQAASREVLLTRRSKALRIFPNVWGATLSRTNRGSVAAFGPQLDPGVSEALFLQIAFFPVLQLLEAGLRELQEETGLWLQDGEFSWHLLGLWESVYPPMLSRGPPKRHHVVIYLLLLSHESRPQLQARLQPNEAEVSAYAWLAPQVLAAVAATQDGVPDSRRASGNLPQTIRITELKDGSAQTVSIPTAVFLNVAPAQGEDTERVSTGTKFALHLWLDAVASQ